jgi:hypothetical protein
MTQRSDYWTISEDRAWWMPHFPRVADAPEDISTLTITRDDKNWRRARDFAHLVELTLHNPDQAQLEALADFPKLTALRISVARPKTLRMLEGHNALRELVLEHVSGVSDLGPLGHLSSLTALHLENLRRVSDFSALGSLHSLRYLAIKGTEWSQPIESFDFLGAMKALEFLELLAVRPPQRPFLLTSLLQLDQLLRMELGIDVFPLEEFAWLAANLAHVEGAVMPPYRRYDGGIRLIEDDYRLNMPLEEFQRYSRLFIGEDGKRYVNERYEASLLGRGQRFVYGAEDLVAKKCAAHEKKYRELIEMYRNN